MEGGGPVARMEEGIVPSLTQYEVEDRYED